MMFIKKLALLSIAGTALGAGSLAVLLWYASAHAHIPSEWGRVYLSSACAGSRLAFHIAKQEYPSGGKIATIPLDSGGLLLPACHHTRRMLADHDLLWRVLDVLPDNLVCNLLVNDGNRWMWKNVENPAWPVFAGATGYEIGVTPESLFVAGVRIDQNELDTHISAFIAEEGDGD